MNNWIKIFDRAYDKCAMLQAGQDIVLNKNEEYILQWTIYRKRNRIARRRVTP